jgi:ADP-heptose:LPS heptosyltransferase
MTVMFQQILVPFDGSARAPFLSTMIAGAPSTTHALQKTPAIKESQPDQGRYLITMGVGIGDAVVVGLSALDQIITNEPEAAGHIDILCNPLQAQLFEEDPRVNRVILTETLFFAGSRISEWPRAIWLDSEGARVARLLRERHYEAVFPAMVAPGLYHALHTRLMYPDLFQLGHDLLTQHAPSDLPAYKLVRHIINRSFDNDAPPESLPEEIPLYLGTRHIQQAISVRERLIKESSVRQAGPQVLLVAADSNSSVTRPPTRLLAAALAPVLRGYDGLLVCVLPGYTDTAAAGNLKNALLPDFAGRVFTLPAEPKPSLLETAALIDQADLLVTGDTGVMHLAATTRRVRQAGAGLCTPRNAVKIIALFGGSNPDVWGYPQRTTIVGRGRKEQHTFSPGFVKELSRATGKDFFDHISPHQLAEAIANQVRPGTLLAY